MIVKDLASELLPKVKYKDHKLSPRQISILLLIADGFSNGEISRILFLSKRTVETHIQQIKTLISKERGHNICDRELVLFAISLSNGLVEYQSKPQVIEDWD